MNNHFTRPGEFIFNTTKEREINREQIRLVGKKEIKSMPPLEWLVKGIIPNKGLVLVYGGSGTGKSFYAFDLACSIAGGIYWFGHKVVQAPVVYIALEGRSGFRLRIEAWEQHTGRSLPEEYKMILQDVKLNDLENLRSLKSIIPNGAMIIIDTLNRAAPTADENSSRDMGIIIESAKALQETCDGVVLIVHHTGKSTSAGPRGHSSLFASCDTAIEISRDGNRRIWTHTKSKEGSDGKSFAFLLEEKILGFDEDGDELSSCVIIPQIDDSQIPRKQREPQGANQKTALRVIKDYLKDGPEPTIKPHGIEYSDAIIKVGSALDVDQERRNERAKNSIASLISKGFLTLEGETLFVV